MLAAARSLDFYSTSAQVLPILFLVVVFEAPRVGSRITPGVDLGVIAIATIALAAAEAAALHALSIGHGTRGLHDVVTLGLSYGALSIMGLVVWEIALQVPGFRGMGPRFALAVVSGWAIAVVAAVWGVLSTS